MKLERLRRFLVWQSLMLWQGGFLFYSAIVVPIGADVLGSDREQGFVTQRVTIWLNRCGWFALLMLAWDIAAVWQLRLVRASIVVVCGVLLAVLVGYLHSKLDGMLDIEEHRIRDRRNFYLWHAVYLWVSVVHWVLMLLICWLTLRAWSERDVTTSPGRGLRERDTSDSVA